MIIPIEYEEIQPVNLYMNLYVILYFILLLYMYKIKYLRYQNSELSDMPVCDLKNKIHFYVYKLQIDEGHCYIISYTIYTQVRY